MDTYSLSDIAAVTGNEGFGMGGGGWIVWILLFALLGGGNFGFNNRNNAASVEDIASGFNFNALQNKGNDILAAVNSEGRNLDNAICTLGYHTLEQSSALSAQMASCCCDLKSAIHAEGEATRNMIQQNKIESLQQQVNALQLNAAMCGVVRYPTSTTYAVPSTCFGSCNTACAY